MKAFARVFLPLSLNILLLVYPSQAQPRLDEPLGDLAEKALAKGRDAELPPGFATFVGLETEKSVPSKQLQIEKDGATNCLHVVRDASNTMVLLDWAIAGNKLKTNLYVTDRAGKLRKAFFNIGPVANWTRLDLKAAAAGFERQKQFWKLWMQHAH